MPPGGAGLYFLYAHALVSDGEFAGFLVRRNGTVLCRAFGDDTAGTDPSTATCGAAVVLEEGKHLSTRITKVPLSAH